LRKKPLSIVPSVYTNSENAIAAKNKNAARMGHPAEAAFLRRSPAAGCRMEAIRLTGLHAFCNRL
jgi:hypothetical protein